MIHIDPQKNTIRIAQIRGLLGTLAMKPYNAAYRVVIIAQSDCMNREAGNALLKILEEPPADTILILTATQREALLPTIASRCRHIRFNVLTTDELVRLLSQRSDVDPLRRQTIARLAEGSYSRALIIAQSQWGQRRDWVVRAAGLDRTDQLKDRNATIALAFSKALADEKAHIDENITLLQTWIRDLTIIAHAPHTIIHHDRVETLQQVRTGLDSDALLDLWKTVEKAQKDIAVNGNLRLTLDVMALQMANILAA
jgi:DNA polymerase-3 subunit delta'